MEYEEHQEQTLDFFSMEDPELVGTLGEALYTMSELSLWPDGVSVSEEQVIMCWKVVEKMRREQFPDGLVM